MRRLQLNQRAMQWWMAALLAAFAAAAGVTSVGARFQRVRERVVREEIRPAPGTAITLLVPRTPSPVSVVVADLRGGRERAPIEVRLNGRTIASPEVGPGAPRRVDVQVPRGLVPGSTVSLSCASDGWSLSSLEMANLHGFSSGFFSFDIVPASRRDFRPLPAWLMVPAALILGWLWMAPSAGRYPRTETAIAGLGLFIWVVTLVAPVASTYRLLLSTPTFLLSLVFVFGASARRRYLALRASLAKANGRAADVVDGALAVAAVFVFFLAMLAHGLAVHEGVYERFLHFSDRFASAPVLDAHPEIRHRLEPQATGYDGQFMFVMAFDPFMRRFEAARYSELVDFPPYRYGRIGFSLLTRAFSGGNPSAFARTMLWLIVGAQLVAACILVAIARHRGASPWQALPYVLIPGFLVSIGSGLPEPVAAALLLGGLWAHLRGRGWLAVALFAASLLVRETGAILVVTLAAWAFARDRQRWRGLHLLLAFVPMAAWRLYVGFRLVAAFGWRAWWSGPGDLTWPMGGFLELWSVNDAAHGHGQPFNTWFPILIVVLLALAIALLRTRPGPLAAAAVAYGALAVSLNYRQIWSWMGNGERGTFELFMLVLVAAMPVATLPRGLRWALACFLVGLFAYDFQVATYASWFRPALLLFR